MPSIEILGTGRIDDRESAFPQAVQLPNGDILCSARGSRLCWGEGPMARGGSDWARSTDGGDRPGPWRALVNILTCAQTGMRPCRSRTLAEADHHHPSAWLPRCVRLRISPDGGTVVRLRRPVLPAAGHAELRLDAQRVHHLPLHRRRPTIWLSASHGSGWLTSDRQTLVPVYRRTAP